jgi:hypothetical protein
MSYTLIWKYSPKEGDQQILIGHPGTYSEDEAQAKEEGRRILADGQIDHHHRQALFPLAVVEANEDIGEDIQERCEEVEIGDELLFYDLDNYARWQNAPWWPK